MTWTLVTGTADYISNDGKYLAIYIGTVRGYGSYMVHLATTPKSKRTRRSAFSIGGLPKSIKETR